MEHKRDDDIQLLTCSPESEQFIPVVADVIFSIFRSHQIET
jgi:hypothetical protein